MEIASLSEGTEKKVKVFDDFSFLDDLEAREQRYRPASTAAQIVHTKDAIASSAQTASTSSGPSLSKAPSGWKKGFLSGPKPHGGTSQTVAAPITSIFKKSDIPASSVPLNVEIVRPESEAVQPEQNSPKQNSAFTAQVRESQGGKSSDEENSTTSENKEEEKETTQRPLSIFAQQRLKMKDKG